MTPAAVYCDDRDVDVSELDIQRNWPGFRSGRSQPKGMETDYRPDAVAKRWTLMLDENEGFGKTPRRLEWKLLNGNIALG